ncbi:1-acyl-sn-glycerol-3-phosphate acyltransferase gamma-like [Leptopilina boulardi]|uniref:1-acyl-sn-glycerol-3-phosphate acyltransferase gamma-like n=1 Tax=Leptopilina boulardi TaxID=63433 RepID=UPI0021F50485|nr:1-acyl-sn-glycerol-3-phosphate acyltransferase gamma-like [Leptopilina boulardi]
MGILMKFKESRVIHLFFAIIFFTSGLIINLFQFILYIGLRPISKYMYRKINYYLCYSFYSQLVFMTAWWSDTIPIIYADKEEYEKYLGKEHGYCIMNHTYEIDWLVGWVFTEPINILGNCKAYAKKSIQYVPTLGWAWKFAESIFLERNWDKDKEMIGVQMKELADFPDAMWLLLFAEGTRFTPEKCIASQKFAKEKGLPLLKHHLTPRTRGFIASLPSMKNKVDAIYDVQLAFKSNEPNKPTMRSLLLGKKVQPYMYVRRIPLSEVPEGDEAAAEWLQQLYQRKDRLSESFNETGDFFKTSGVPKLDSIKYNRRIYPVINLIFWAIVILVPMMYYLVRLFLSGSTIYFSIGAGIIGLFFLMMHKIIGMSEISKSSSHYGSAEAQKTK